MIDVILPLKMNDQTAEYKKERQRIIELITKAILEYLPNTHVHVPMLGGPWTFASTFLLPAIAVGVPFGLSWANPCLMYPEVLVLRNVSLGLYCGCTAMAWIHLVVYNKHVLFCSPYAIRSHNYHTAALFFQLGATLFWLDYFAYNPWWLWYFFSAISSCAAYLGMYLSYMRD